MSWYRTGTVTVTNGSKTVTGVGTLWTSAVNAGDAFALVDANLNPTGAWYEVESVTNNTTLVLKQNYAATGGSGKAYCIFNLVGNQTTPSFAARLATFFANFQTLLDKPTTTPTASSIPIADANGDIDSGWIKNATTSVKGVVELATSAETTTATDSTRAVTPAGALELLRKFGLGASGQATYIGAANDLTTSGLYIISNSATGFPSTGAGVCLVQVATSLNIQQWFMTMSNDVHRLFVRNRFSETWGDWRMIAAPLLGTVSQSSGVPTGSVIERGSNANGEYVRFADGTQICTVRFTNFPSIQAGGTVPGTTNKAWTFPAAFGDSNSIAVSAVVEVSSAHEFTGFSSFIGSSTSANLRLGLLSTTSAAELAVRALAIGRWF